RLSALLPFECSREIVGGCGGCPCSAKGNRAGRASGAVGRIGVGRHNVLQIFSDESHHQRSRARRLQGGIRGAAFAKRRVEIDRQRDGDRRGHHQREQKLNQRKTLRPAMLESLAIHKKPARWLPLRHCVPLAGTAALRWYASVESVTDVSFD